MSHHGKIYWTELNTWDAEAAKTYYGAVMGWTFQEAPTAGTTVDRPYYIAMRDGHPVAGIFTLIKPMFEGVPEHWFTYLAVDGLNAALAAGTDAGGRVLRDPFEIPGFGMFAVVADKNGAAMGFLEPAQQGDQQ